MWTFLLILNLIIPAIMIVFGALFLRRPPKDINVLYGYRTRLAMQNKDTWAFAHHYAGRLWLVCGVVLVPVTIAGMLVLRTQGEDTVTSIGGLFALIQLVVLVATFLPNGRCAAPLTGTGTGLTVQAASNSREPAPAAWCGGWFAAPGMFEN